MENNQFCNLLVTHLNISLSEVEKRHEILMQIIKERSVAMDNINIQRFGIFEPKKKAERITIHPATGKKILIPPKMVLNFKPSLALKNKLKELSNNE